VTKPSFSSHPTPPKSGLIHLRSVARGRWRASLRPARAELLKRTFGFDVLTCPCCGGRMRLLALVMDPKSIARRIREPGFVIPEGGRPSSATHSGRSNTMGRRSKGSGPRRHSGPAGGVVPETADAASTALPSPSSSDSIHVRRPNGPGVKKRKYFLCDVCPQAALATMPSSLRTVGLALVLAACGSQSHQYSNA